MARPKKNSQTTAIVVVAFASLVTSCVGREAGNRLTSLAEEDVFVEEKPLPVDDAEYPKLVDTKAPATTAAVTIALDKRFQKLEGFGASVAWYQERLVGQLAKGVYEFLFPEAGLDILRLRNRYDRKDYKDGRTDWDAEIYKRGSAALGRPLRVMLSAWSPPSALKANQAEKCKGGDDCTLIKESGKFVYEKYAEFWLDSLRHYAELGVPVEYVSIQNEPDFIPPDWEGCKFTPTETAQFPGYNKALAAVHAKVMPAFPGTKLLGPEVLGIHYNRVQDYVTPMNLDLVYGVDHHIYEKGPDNVWDWRDPGPDSYLDEMQSVAELIKNKPLFQTEFNTDEDNGNEGGFETAWLIHHSLVGEGAASFLYWELIWEGTKGLVGMQGKAPQPRDQYYSMRHFARFTDPGYVRVDARSDSKNLLASAYVAPDGKQLTAVLLNTAKNAIHTQVDPGQFGATKVTAFRTVYRPGHSRRWETLHSTSPVEMPARSVVTLVFDK
jgi:glucuronoarabinoxylan endo-1,4-beta-xylanase